MAVVTSHAPDIEFPDQKLSKMAPAVDTDGKDGSLEVNGHASPNGIVVESKTNGDSGAEAKADLNSAETNHKQNSDAFSSNQDTTTSEMEQPQERKATEPAEDVPKLDDKTTESGVASEAEKPTDKEADAQPEKTEDKPEKLEEKSEEKPEEKSEQDVVDPSEAKPADQPEAPVEQNEQVTTQQDETTGESTNKAPAAKPSTESDKPPAAKPADSQDEGEDVDMTDALAKPDPAPEATEADAKPVPADEPATQASTIASAPADSPEASQPPPGTADTSMSDAPSVKVSRDREDDEAEAPAAKRLKVEPSETEAEATLSVAQAAASQSTAPESQPMDVDSAAATVEEVEIFLYFPDGLPKPLGHPSLDKTKITDFQSKQLRNVLAGVKKTKNGMNFRQSVQTLWPGFWADYSAKIKNPVDISSFEKRLRGEADPYPDMAAFKADVDLLVQNAVTFNGEGHQISQSAVLTRDEILSRMESRPAVEPLRIKKEETVKHQPKRHAEQRASQAIPPPPVPVAKPKPAAPVVQLREPVESPAFAIPPNNNGIPVIRRDSSKVGDNRPKRPVKPPKPKDLPDDGKKRKKLSPELRFCEEVIQEITKNRHWAINNAFMQPVDPVALNIPQYHKIVKKPMDLGTMSNKLAQGEYSNAKEFERDFHLIIQNCRTFNGETHPVTEQAGLLQELFKQQWSSKDTWLAKNAPSTESRSHASATSPRPKDDDSDEELDSEDEPMQDDSKPASSDRLRTLEARVKEEQAKVDKEMSAAKPDATIVEIAQTIISGLQMSIIKERTRLAEEAAKKPKSKPSKPKKSGTSGASGAGRKATVASQPTKKTSGPKKAATKRKVTNIEKEVIAEGIGQLEGIDLDRAILIIKKDTNTGENPDGELELDIEILSNEALLKLLDIVNRANPEILQEKKAAATDMQSSDPFEPDPAPAKSKASKSKKNKPMSKKEQEARLAQLSQLRAAAQRQGSGSQEPMESIEGNSGQPASAVTETAPLLEPDSADEEDSEEE